MSKCNLATWLMASVLLTGAATPSPLRFEHLTINDGLPENSVRTILQDRQGYLWFGTHNGVARYDGSRMLVHLPDPDDPHSIDIRFVLAMAEDDTGAIWMGSYSAGLSRYDPVRETFTNFPPGGETTPGPGIAALQAASDGIWITDGAGRLFRTSGSRFEQIPVPPFDAEPATGLAGLAVAEHELWVGSTEHGVAWLDRHSGRWRHLRSDAADPESLPSDYVTFIARDAEGRVWIGSRAGLALHKGNGRFTVFRPRPELGPADANYLVCTSFDSTGRMWLGSAVGLYTFDPRTGEFVLHAHDPDRPNSPVRGPVLSVHCDRSGIVWAGSWHTGLNKYDPGSAKFAVARHDPTDPASLDDDAIGAVFEASDGTLWVGTGIRSSGSTVGGLNYRAAGADGFVQIPFPRVGSSHVLTVNVILERRPGEIWVGTNLGLWQVAADRTSVLRPTALGSAPAALFDAMITDMDADHAGRIWVATWLRGLHRLDPLTGGWTSYGAGPQAPGGLAGTDLITLCVDGEGRVWLGTDGGHLQVYDPDSDGFVPALSRPYATEGICEIIRGEGDQVLIGTGAGILVAEGDSLLHTYTTRNGLPSDYVGRLVRDAAGDLWASTGLGLVRIPAGGDPVAVFDRRDGLPRNEVHFGSTITADGTLYFGGRHGLVAFHPSALRLNTYIPPVRITELRLNDEPLTVDPDSPLSRSLDYTGEVVFRHDENDISLVFAALDFAHPERNRYRFRLTPGDEDWRDARGDHAAHYTNLDPGSYVFAVMGSNGDGVWNPEPTELRIVITPPWHRTGWAIALYLLAALGFAVAVYRTLLNRERMRMALEMERAEASHLHNLDQLKSRFFANISHEFRTPLTLLMAPLQGLQENPGSGSQELFATMFRNARRLQRLIDQLLDLSRLEADRMPSRWRQGDWCRFMKALVSSFASLAEQRGIVLEARWPDDPPAAWYDADLVEKILANLLSNALKFTPGGGEIAVSVDVGREPVLRPWPGEPGRATGEAVIVVCTVHNTGSHISQTDQEHVFDRFHQVVESSDFGDLGTGIGLALVKELAEWAGGGVGVASSSRTGTTFTASLPFFLSAPPRGLAMATEVRPAESVQELAEPADHDEDTDDPADTGAPRVLVVEDSNDLRNYVREELGDEFQVLVAANGRAGLELAHNEIPDLVLSDVMMPGLDGMELCHRLKDDDLTSHIPVILLTAKADADSRRAGLETGADDYIAKPFDVSELRLRIRNLIDQRRLLADRFARAGFAGSDEPAPPAPTADDRFLTRVRQLIAENIEDPDFRVDGLCREIGMSRTQLHRKLKAVAGRSAGEFLRAERLNEAARMLATGEENVTGVAYSVGYRSLSQFAKAFRDQFGQAPSDYAG